MLLGVPRCFLRSLRSPGLLIGNSVLVGLINGIPTPMVSEKGLLLLEKTEKLQIQSAILWVHTLRFYMTREGYQCVKGPHTSALKVHKVGSDTRKFLKKNKTHAFYNFKISFSLSCLIPIRD